MLQTTGASVVYADMPRTRRLQLELQLSEYIEDHSLHGVLHALIEICYSRARAGAASETPADRWSHMARLLTRLEAEAATMGL